MNVLTVENSDLERENYCSPDQIINWIHFVARVSQNAGLEGKLEAQASSVIYEHGSTMGKWTLNEALALSTGGMLVT